MVSRPVVFRPDAKVRLTKKGTPPFGYPTGLPLVPPKHYYQPCIQVEREPGSRSGLTRMAGPRERDLRSETASFGLATDMDLGTRLWRPPTERPDGGSLSAYLAASGTPASNKPADTPEAAHRAPAKPTPEHRGEPDQVSAPVGPAVDPAWVDVGARLGFIPLRNNVAVVVAGDAADRDVADRVRAMRLALDEHRFGHVTLSVAATGMDRFTFKRVTEAGAYVVDVPQGFSEMSNDERLSTLREILPAPKPPSMKRARRSAPEVGDKEAPKRYLKRNSSLSRDDVKEWRNGYAAPAGCE